MSNLENTNTEVAINEAGAANEGVFASLGLNGQLFVFQLLNFALVAAIIWWLILKPLTKKLEQRKKIIDESLDKAKEIDTSLQMAEQKFQERVDEAKAEASKIVAKSQAQGEQVVVQMKDKARQEIELVIDQAKRNIKIEKEEVMAGIKKETVGLVTAVAEKLLSAKLDESKDKKLIEQILKKIKTDKE